MARTKTKPASDLDAADEVEVKLYLPRDLHDHLAAELEGRGTSIEAFIKVAARGYLRRPRSYELHTQLGFGKYYGEKMEDIIRIDPRYIRWCIGNLAGGLVLSEEAHTLLEQVDPLVTVKRK